MPENTIGSWSERQLIRFVENILRGRPTTATKSFSADDLIAAQRLTCMDKIQFMQSQTTVGSAGSATALPAQPIGYFKVYDSTGTLRVIPYYNAS